MVRAAPPETRAEIVERHYRPYRQQAEQAARAAIDAGRRLIHISSHSFTPELDGQRRNADIGLLYDPSRQDEASWCMLWQSALRRRAPYLRVRRNYPYSGKSDGLCAFLRKRHPPEQYLGMELEINQRYPLQGGDLWENLRKKTLAALLDTLPALEKPD
jgi:predicted N-formylglutamate amidohydrolase